MKPSELSKSLRHIAAKIDASVRPDRILVSRDLKRVLAAMIHTSMDNVPVGNFILDTVELVHDEEENPAFPTFLVKGKCHGRVFEAKIGLSLEDQEADVEYVSGYDLNDAWNDIKGYDTAELFILINESSAYAEAVKIHESESDES